ncbi:MAG: hypothetical protein HC938_10885 [Nitrospira sp.]|nr:hypothetical protein [Nitrospira sp.]
MRRSVSIHSQIAETIAIGSELLVGGRTDTNSLFITEALGAIGIEVRFKSIVGDDQSDIAQVVKTACKRARIVILTGGLGPTVDDCTREAVAAITGFRLARRKEALEGMKIRLAQWGADTEYKAIATGLDSVWSHRVAQPGWLSTRLCLVMARDTHHRVTRCPE